MLRVTEKVVGLGAPATSPTLILMETPHCGVAWISPEQLLSAITEKEGPIAPLSSGSIEPVSSTFPFESITEIEPLGPVT